MERVEVVQQAGDVRRIARRHTRTPEASERRAAPRLAGRVSFSAGRLEGSGLIGDLSLAGAHVVQATVSPTLGTRVRLFFATPESDHPLSASGRVTRRGATDFALKFDAVEPSLQGALLAARSAAYTPGA